MNETEPDGAPIVAEGAEPRPTSGPLLDRSVRSALAIYLACLVLVLVLYHFQ